MPLEFKLRIGVIGTDDIAMHETDMRQVEKIVHVQQVIGGQRYVSARRCPLGMIVLVKIGDHGLVRRGLTHPGRR